MGLVRNLVFGRPNGIRAKLWGLVGGPAEDTSPSSSYSAPRSDEPPPPPAEAALGLSPEPPRDVTPPDGYEVVLHKDALETGRVVEIIIGGKAIALAHTDEGYRASTNECPRAGGPLGEGELNGVVLTCPYCGWTFDLNKGVCLTNTSAAFTIFDVQTVGEAVCVKL